MQNKKVLLIIGVLAVVALVLLVYNQNRQNTKQQPGQNSPPPALPPKVSVSQNSVDVSKLPEGFPSDLPLEKGSATLGNYTGSGEDGRVQGTRKFESKRSLAENEKIYREYFTSAGWEVKLTLNSLNQKVLELKRGEKQSGFVGMTFKEIKSLVEVEITLIEFK